MAAVPQSLVETARRSISPSRKGALSHGRGGAGNIGNTASPVDPVDLQTPTIKSDVYTTGRGGSGNMSKNVDPEATRKAQDVAAAPRRISQGQSHVGRGGAANVFKPSAEELAQAKEENSKWESAVQDEVEHGIKTGDKERSKGLADKGKEWLFGKKN